MKMTTNHRVVLHVDLVVAVPLLMVASNNRAQSITATELVPMSEQITVVIYLVETVRSIRDGEADPAVFLEVQGQKLVEEPVEVGEVTPLSSDLMGVTPVITRHTGDEDTLELVSKRVDTPDQNLVYIDKGRHDFYFVGRHELFVDVTREHVASKGEHDAGVLGVDHVIGE